MKKTLAGVVESGEPLMRQVVDALRRYHEARDLLAPPEEVERLRLEAESLFEAVQEYQFRLLGGPTHPFISPFMSDAGGIPPHVGEQPRICRFFSSVFST
ncbi:hypothetical protein D3C77_182780 [compost metagenome]